MLHKINKELYEKILHFSHFTQTGVSLSQLVNLGRNPTVGTLLKASHFIAEELPVRLAHRVVELESLPNNLNKMPSVERVKLWYAESFEEITSFNKKATESLKKNFKTIKLVETIEPDFPKAKRNLDIPDSYRSNSSRVNQFRYYVPTTEEKKSSALLTNNEKFVNLMEKIKNRHDPVVYTLAQGIAEYKKEKGPIHTDHLFQSFLDRFHMSRIGIRMLLGQHISLHRGPFHKDYVGLICIKTNISEILQLAISNATVVCEEHFGLFKAPEIVLDCPEDIEFMYVPNHLHHMLFELLKNSLRAVVDRFGKDFSGVYPKIKVFVASGVEDITIKVSDEGNGIPRSLLPVIWNYTYTTAEAPLIEADFNKSDFKAPLAGLGYGLPLSRLYARYFGGDIKVISMEGYGTDAFLHLSRLSDSEEPLP